MKIISLEISNILSIETAKLVFSDNGLVLVEGWNHDAGRANGAGKTAIFNALSFGLYDKLPRKVTASEILRRGARSGFVKVEVNLPTGPATVTRSRPKGVVFEQNGIVQDWTQAEWESKIRLSYSQFILSMYSAQDADKRFILLNDSSKKDFILQLLDLVEFAACKDTTDGLVKGFVGEIEQASAKIATVSAKIAAYQESLIDKNSVKLRLASLTDEIDKLNKALEEQISVPKPDLSKYSKLESDIRTKQSAFVSTKARSSMLHDQYRRLSAKIKEFSGQKTCFACGQGIDTSEAERLHELEMLQLKKQLKELKTDIDACDTVLVSENSIDELARKLADKKIKESEAYRSAQECAAELRSLLRIKQNTSENLVLKLQQNSELLDKIQTLTESINVSEQTIACKKRDVEFYKTISALYSTTGAQAYILDSVVDSFNEYVAKYVDLVWPNATYKLNSYKESVKGDVVAKFSETFMMNAQDVSSGSLSGGELRALSLCADFAILDVLEMHFGMPLNPIILDEPFNGLDAAGREVVIELLEKLSKNRQILVVDHASEAKSMFSKVILVEKQNGISTVSSSS
jgi:DNA repair exonuclease SbcCD ATPase subunit